MLVERTLDFAFLHAGIDIWIMATCDHENTAKLQLCRVRLQQRPGTECDQEVP